MRLAILVFRNLREIRKKFRCLVHILDNLIIVHDHRCRPRSIHIYRLSSIQDDRNTAVRAVVTIIRCNPEHGESSPEICCTYSLVDVFLVQILHGRNNLDDVVCLGIDLIHCTPGIFHITSVGRRHLEIPNLVRLSLRTSYSNVVTAAFEPHDTTSCNTFRVVRHIGPESRYSPVHVVFCFPCSGCTILRHFEKVRATRHDEGGTYAAYRQ